jgi:hypothetical protein
VEFIKFVTDALGVPIPTFLLVSAVVLVAITILRYGTKSQPWAPSDWFKAVTLGSAFLAQAAKLYAVENTARLALVGFFNGTVAVTAWHGLKRIPWVKQFVSGLEKKE